MITYICTLKYLNPALKLGFLAHDKHLNLCVQVENYKGTLFIRKTVVEIGYLRSYNFVHIHYTGCL